MLVLLEVNKGRNSVIHFSRCPVSSKQPQRTMRVNEELNFLDCFTLLFYESKCVCFVVQVCMDYVAITLLFLCLLHFKIQTIQRV